jgi:hypothetical protein
VTDARILEALGIPADATEKGIAEGLRRLAGLPPVASGDPALWMRILAGIDVAVRHSDERADLALFAHGIASHAIAAPGEPSEERFGVEAWDLEWGVNDGESDERLRELAIDELAPRLWDARLVYIINYV